MAARHGSESPDPANETPAIELGDEDGSAPDSPQPTAKPGPARQLRAALLGAMALLLIILSATVGLRAEHYAAAAAVGAFIFIGGWAWQFLLLYWPVPATGLVYDLSRKIALTNPDVHVADLYYAELRWFGVGSGADRQILADYFLTRTSAALDLICGLSYMVYLYVPMVLAAALFFVSRRHMKLMAWGFFVTNVIGIVVYMLYPAAPPWYVAKYGLGPVQLDALPDAAGTLRFDALLGVDYFREFYARSSHVFGAMPSLHVGYTAAAALALVGLGWRWVLPVAALVVLVGFSALYLQHHYLIDVIAGGACAAVAYAIVRLGVDRRLVPKRKAR